MALTYPWLLELQQLICRYELGSFWTKIFTYFTSPCYLFLFILQTSDIVSEE